MKGDGIGMSIIGLLVILATVILIITVDYDVIDEGLKREHMEKVIGLQENRARKILEASGWEVSVGEWVTRPRWHGRVCFTCRTGENSIRLIIGAEEVYPPAP